MSFIRRNPFKNVEPKDFMIDCIDREAQRLGQPLTPQERELLRTDNPYTDRATELRLRSIIANIYETENAGGKTMPPPTFSDGIEWGTDLGEWPFVIALAVAVAQGKPDVEKVTHYKVEGCKVKLLVASVIGILILTAAWVIGKIAR
jgi:hypothetical protein